MNRKAKPNPLIEDELFDDEELVWWGQPIAHHLMRKISLPQMGMAIFMLVFASFFYLQTQEMFSGSRSTFGGRSSFPSFLPILFTIVPAFMALGSLWTLSTPIQQWIKGRRTYYALTNKRAIIIEQLFSKTVQSFYDEQIEQMQVTTYVGGVGDIIFATQIGQRQIRSGRRNGLNITFEDGGMNVSSGRRTRTVTYQIQQGFKAIPDVRVVEDFISQIFFSDDDAPSKTKSAPVEPKPSEPSPVQQSLFDGMTVKKGIEVIEKAEAFLERGMEYSRERNFRAAIEEYSKSIETNPNNPIAYNKRAEAYMELMEFDTLLDDCNSAILYDPNYAQAYNNRGFAYLLLGKYDDALKDLNRCLELNPNHKMANYNKGSAYMHLKDYENARDSYDEAIKIKPTMAEAYSNRAITHHVLGDNPSAIADWDKAVELGLELPPSLAEKHAELKASL